VHSELDDIPGIGAARKKALLRHFVSVEKIKQATVEELAAVNGMSKKAAEEIANYFRGAGEDQGTGVRVQGAGKNRDQSEGDRIS